MYDRALTGIVVDAGHGGVDSGATGNGIVEKELTLAISEYMYDRFRELGVPVAMTRTKDEELTSTTRPQRALEKFGSGKDVIVISNHINAGGADGAEVIYALRNKSTLSESILNNLAQEGQEARKYYQRRLPGNPAKDYYYMLRETPNTEAIIVEYGFLDNKSDAEDLKKNYKKYAEAVIRAVMKYKGLNYTPTSDSGFYTVKSGDTLWTIAKNNGLTVNELKKLNNLSSNSLSIGQILKISDNKLYNGTTSNENEYIVKSGDTLYAIANKFGISVDSLKIENNLSTNTLIIGQKLLIPNKKTETDNYIVKQGDSLYKIALEYNTTVDKIKSLNNLTSNLLSIGQVLKLPINNTVYTVKSGDTLYSIAYKYNTSIQKIKSLNNLLTNTLSVGQKLLIP